MTFGQLTTTFEVTVREDIVTLETTLEDGITQRNSRMTFDVFAKDGDGNKLPASEVTVLLNGDPVSVNWTMTPRPAIPCTLPRRASTPSWSRPTSPL